MGRMLVFEPDFLLGNHGIEGLPGWETHATTFEEICEHWHAQLSTQLAAIDKQLWIEYKRYSLSVHYMHVANPIDVAILLREIFATLSPAPRVIAGKSVFNLLPPNANDKGKAVIELMSFTGASCALYAGDDVTDEYVFELNRPDLFTIRVGAGADSAASYQIADHESIIPLMDLLIEYLPHQRKQG
jgi:trehalose 6-phosphate phosphatase